MSNTSYNKYWVPGWRGVLKSGQRVVTVVGSDISKEAWDWYFKLSKRGSRWQVGELNDGVWKCHDELPEILPLTGGVDKEYPSSDKSTVVLEEEYNLFFETVNELGEVAP